MRIRLTALTLGLYLSFALLGCNKPAAPADSTSSSTSSPSPSDSSAAPRSRAGGSGSAMSNTAMSSMKPEAPKRLVVPGRHRVDGSPRTIGWLQDQHTRPDFHGHIGQPGFGRWQTAIPAGASASGTVVDAKPLGRFKGGASLQLRLTSITVGGSDQSISTSSVVRTATGKGKRTAVLAGGGAASGSLDRRTGWRR